MVSKGKRLTVGDKIMVLLLDYTRFRGELQAPLDVTQDGIANNLGIIRSAVPRAVGSLINKELVEEHLAHIDGLTRRRKVYMLTDKGVMEAKELLDELKAISVEVKDEDKRDTKSIGELLEEGSVNLKNVSEVVSSGKLDKDRPPETKEDRKGHILYTHSLSPPDMFMGREREIEEIKSFLSSPKKKIYVIYGIAGVGKTTLSWRITQMFQKEMNIFYIDLKEWTSINYLFKELGRFLARSGWETLRSYLENTQDIDIEAVSDLLREAPSEVPYLLIIDDLHRGPGEIEMFLTSFKERIGNLRKFNMLVLSRKKASFYDIRDVRIKNLIGEMELLGFDRETSKKFLQKRGFKDDEVDTIIDRTGGHPLALVLVEREGYNYDIADFDQFLADEIFNNLTREELKVLGLLSLCRLQLGEDDIRMVMEVDPEVMKSLMDHHLIFGTPGSYVIHDLIKDHSVTNLSREDRVEAHRLLAELFHNKLESLGFHENIQGDVPPFPFGKEDESGLGPVPLYVSEEIYHLLGSGSAVESMETLIKANMQIPTKDLLKEMGRNIGEALVSRLDPKHRMMKDFMYSLIDIRDDDFEIALKRFRKIDIKEPKDDITRAIADCVKLWTPYLMEKVEGPGKSLKALERIDDEKIPKKLRYYFMVTKASLLYKLGNHEAASEAYKDFLGAIKSNEELPEKLKEYIDSSLARAEDGSIQVATDNFQKIMELTTANRDVLREEMPYVDVDHHLLSAIYSSYHGRK
ncbi:MAG: ATP-binding protein [Thermoplasmatota archaeon]